MSRASAAVILVVASLVQVTWSENLTVLGAFPNIALVAVVAIAWTHGQRAGLAAACIAGLVLDLAAPGPLGPHAIALLAGAYLTGFLSRNVDRSSVAQPALATFIAAAAYAAVLAGANELLGLGGPELGVALRLTGAGALYDALLAIPAVLVLRQTAGEVTA